MSGALVQHLSSSLRLPSALRTGGTGTMGDSGSWLGIALSASAHVALAGWAASAGLLSHDAGPPPAGTTVSLISAAAYDAMVSVAPHTIGTTPDSAPAPAPDVFQTGAPEAEARLALSIVPAPALAAPTLDGAPTESAGLNAPPLAKPSRHARTSPAPERKPQPPAMSEPPAVLTALERLPDPADTAARPAGGSGGASKSGGRQDRASLTGNAKNDRSLIADWGSRIRARVDRAKRYPRAERAAGTTGTVTLRLSVTPSGKVSGLKVAKSSGIAALDAAAVAAVRGAGRLPPAPPGLADAVYSFNLPVAFAR